jgi:hypothetical protein
VDEEEDESSAGMNIQSRVIGRDFKVESDSPRQK